MSTDGLLKALERCKRLAQDSSLELSQRQKALQLLAAYKALPKPYEVGLAKAEELHTRRKALENQMWKFLETILQEYQQKRIRSKMSEHI